MLAVHLCAAVLLVTLSCCEAVPTSDASQFNSEKVPADHGPFLMEKVAKMLLHSSDHEIDLPRKRRDLDGWQEILFGLARQRNSNNGQTSQRGVKRGSPGARDYEDASENLWNLLTGIRTQQKLLEKLLEKELE